MRNLLAITLAPLLALGANEAGAADIIGHTAEIVSQIIIAVIALIHLWKSKRKKQ